MSTSEATTERPVRRKLHFDSVAQAIAEGKRIADWERSGKARYAGNWTAGQILNHLGAWAEYAFTGAPLRVPWFIKVLGRPMKKGILRRGMPAGSRIPRVPNGTLATERVSAEEGLARFEAALQRLEKESPPDRHPIFGAMPHADWIALNLRHAELHMSFVTN